MNFTLRDSSGSPKLKQMESKWDKKTGMLISDFNEKVHPRYKLTFD